MIELSKKLLFNKEKSNDFFLFIKKHKAISYVIGANIISLMIGAVLSFLIPYMLKITDYGYYKQFTLYLSYVGLLHFGFNDGIYLEYGACNYEDLDKKKFRMYFRYLLFQQLMTSIVLLIFIFLIFQDQKRLFIFSFVVFNMILLNLTKYFCYISQVTKHFFLYSVAYLIEKTALIIPLTFLFLINQSSFQYVVISQTMIYALLISLFIYIYKDLVFGYRELLNKIEIKRIMSIGMSLMLGNFIIIMIFNIDRLMIDLFLTIKDFSIYSLAVACLSMILVFITSISMLFYPYLKRKAVSSYKAYYEKLSIIIACFSALALSSFFPIKYIIMNYLPQYKASIPIFLILLPGVALRGEIDIIFNNLFKSLKKQSIYFMISILVLLISIILNIILFYFYRNMYSITISSLLTFIIWYILSDLYLMRYFKINQIKKYFYLIIAYGTYFLFANSNNLLQGFLVYIILSIIIILLVFFKQIKLLKNT